MMNALELVISIFSFSFATMSAILIWAMKRFIDNAKKNDDQIMKEIFDVKRILDVLNANFKNAHIDLNALSGRVDKNENILNDLKERVAVLEQKKS